MVISSLPSSPPTPPQNAINLPLQELFSRVLQETMLSKNRSIRIRSRGYTDRIRKFNVGDLVWLYIPATKKINLNWHGHFAILRLIGNACFVIQPVLVAGREMLVHISRIRKCTAKITDVRKHLGVSDPSQEQ